MDDDIDQAYDSIFEKNTKNAQKKFIDNYYANRMIELKNNKSLGELSADIVTLFRQYNQSSQTDLFGKSLNEIVLQLFSEAGLILNVVKLDEFMSYLNQMNKHIQKIHFLGRQHESFNDQPQMEQQIKYISKWIISNQVYLQEGYKPRIARNRGIQSKLVGQSYENFERMKNQRQFQSVNRSIDFSTLERPEIYQIRKKNQTTIQKINEKNVQLLSQMINRYQDEREHSYKNREILRHIFQDPQTHQKSGFLQKYSPKSDLNKTFYTQQKDNMSDIMAAEQTVTTNKSKFVKFPQINARKDDDEEENPYQDHSNINLPSYSLERVQRTIDKTKLKQSIATFFNCIEVDKKNFGNFKRSLKDELNRKEIYADDQIIRNQNKIKQYMRERKRKEEQVLSKSLEKMIIHMPQKSTACRLEQIMTTKTIGEMPGQYRIKSYFDFDPKADQRIKELLKDL